MKLTLEETRRADSLRSQIATLKRGQHIKHAAHAHGTWSDHACQRVEQPGSDELEQKYDGNFREVFEAIRQVMLPISGPKKDWVRRSNEESTDQGIEKVKCRRSVAALSKFGDRIVALAYDRGQNSPASEAHK